MKREHGGTSRPMGFSFPSDSCPVFQAFPHLVSPQLAELPLGACEQCRPPTFCTMVPWAFSPLALNNMCEYTWLRLSYEFYLI